MTATIDFHHGTFYVSVFRGRERIEYRRGDYRDVIAFAVGMGVPRRDVNLTLAAQNAAMGAVR
ncbi:MAG: hypothetical protein AB7U23_11310 [Dehalococcoidia bacterium]